MEPGMEPLSPLVVTPKRASCMHSMNATTTETWRDRSHGCVEGMYRWISMGTYTASTPDYLAGP